MNNLNLTPPELWYSYDNYVNYCAAVHVEPLSEAVWSALHTAYLATLPPKPKTLEERVTELEQRMNEWEGDNR